MNEREVGGAQNENFVMNEREVGNNRCSIVSVHKLISVIMLADRFGT